MGKKLFSLCMALALCLGLLPVTALAVDTAPQTLYVGSTTIGTGYWTSSDGGKVWTSPADEPEGNNYIYYDGQGTLKLHNVTIQGADNTGSPPYGAGIYALCSQDQPVALTIELIGTNTITGYYGIFLNAEIDASSYGTNATLTITGENNGSLGVSGSDHGIYVKSGTGNASINIKNVAVTSSTNGNSAAGVYVMSSSTATNSPNISLSVDGGSLTASGTGSSDGIWFYVGSSQATGATTSLTVSDNAIVRANGGIKASRVDEPTPSGTGIVFDGTEGTVYGDVTLDESLTINQGETLTIPEGSSLDASGKLTNEGTINVESGGSVSGNLSGGKPLTTPSISQQPQSTTVTEGSTAEFSITASDAQTYQWQRKATYTESEWENISDATTTSYTTAATTTNMNGYQYRCVVTGSGGVSVISQTATLTVNQGVSPTSYSISANVAPAGAGTVTVNGSGTSATVTANSDVTLTATANDGYRFTGWMENDRQVSTDATYTFKATGDRTLTAKFEKVYTITVNVSGGGMATADKTTAAAGEAVTLTATPDSGYRFTGWTSSDGVTFANASSESTTFTMPAGDVTVRAVFSPVVNIPDTHEIELIVGDGGEAKLSLTNASAGSTITVTATPDEGYELAYITVDGERISGTTFKMPDHDVTVRVYFTDGSATLPFTDVSAGAWYLDAVSYVYANGLMDGTSGTTFEPDANMTRAMVWAILARVDGETVTGTNWIETAREWAMAEGVSDGENASGYVTREQLATMLYRYAVYKGYDVSIGEDTNILSYDDFADLSEYAIPAMQWACGAGVITGVTDATLVPQGEATRAQVAAMLMRFVEAIG